MNFNVKHSFRTSASALYSAWLDSDTHTAMTGGEAEVSQIVGDSFMAWDGYISGSNLELIKDSYIKQSWRTTEFGDDEEDSIIEIHFTEKGGTTELSLTHSNLPPHGMQYLKGWENHYFAPMTLYFNQ